MEKLKPKLFSVMKSYTKEQFVKDVIAGIIVAIIALPLSIALALASGVTPEKGIYTAITAGFVISFSGWQPRTDRRSYCGICHHCCRNCSEERHGRSDHRDIVSGCDPDPDGIFTTWQSDQVYPLYDHHRFYFRYCCDDLYRTDQGLPGTDHWSAKSR